LLELWNAIDFDRLLPLTFLAVMFGFAASVMLDKLTRYINEPALSVKSELKEELANRITHLDSKIHEIENSAYARIYSAEEKEQIIFAIQKKIESESANEVLQNLKTALQKEVRSDDRRFLFAQTIDRLKREVWSLQRRGGVNLVIGIAVAIAGALFLGLAVSFSPATSDYHVLLAYFVPRITLTLMIEVFAYFFLRLYSNSLSEIKYFQNELTNIELKRIALETALQKEDSEDLQTNILEGLGTTERNFVLSKKQTTVELEKERL
jgi:uncharacterized membrane protein YjfL (UPF0719 family)